MKHTMTIFRREIAGYFATPVAYVFIFIFLFLVGFLTFSVGDFYRDGRGQADLGLFFLFHPYLYMFLMPAISMRLWAEERKAGTIELLLTLPVSMGQAVIGKFLAAWAFAVTALAFTFPYWIMVNVLGSPDNGVILAGYVGSALMSGAFLAIGSCISAFTKNQVIAFVVSVVICFLFMLAGFPWVLDLIPSWTPEIITSAIADFSFFTHFESIRKGVIDLYGLTFFVSVIAFWLFANAVIIDLKKAD